MANLPNISKSVSQPSKPKTWLHRVDDGIYLLEKGIVTFALFAMALTYFLDIAHLEFLAKDNALDRLIYRFMGIGSNERPSDSLHDRVHGFWSPLILVVVALLLAYGAITARDKEGKLKFGGKAARALAVVGCIGLFVATIVYVPSNWVMIGFFCVIVAIYGRIALTQAKTTLITYVIVWVIAAYPILAVIYSVGTGYAWSTDVAKIMIMWVGFLGASMATKEQKHIRIDFIRKAVPDAYRSMYNAFSHFVTIIFCLVLLVLAVVYLQQRINLGAILPSIHLKAWLIVAPIPVSIALMVARFTGRFVVALRGGEVGTETTGVS
ncbi:MAG: TRAP transporter small permease subunit [Myxococcales bacterium]|nr:TRAP transporter small permease subunit [Myxococcales bacterium]